MKTTRSRAVLALYVLLVLTLGIASAQVYQLDGKTGYFSAGTGIALGGGHAGTKADPHPINNAGLAISGTDNHAVRMDGTTGIQQAVNIVMDDFDNLTGVKDFVCTDDISFGASGGDLVTFGRVGTGTIFYRWPAATANAVLMTPAAGSPWDLEWASAYTDFPSFAAAARIHGSGSGGTPSIELVAEDGLDIDANGIGIATDGVTTAMLADLAGGASRVHGSGSGGAAALDLRIERGLDADADGIGIATDGVTTAMLADRGAASRIIGSGSGGAGTIDLTAEDGLDIDADGIGITAGGVTAAMLDDDQNPIYKLVAVSSANHTCDGTERFVSMTTGGSNRTVNLDDPVAGQVCTVMKADAAGGTVTLDGAGGDTINGATTVVLAATQFKYGTIVAISTSAWIVIASN